jgi:hypothetical protein
MNFTSGLDAFAVLFARQGASRTVFGDPALRGLIVQEIEPQDSDVDRAPFSIVPRPGKVSVTDLALAMKERAAVDQDLLLRPETSGREMKPGQ